MTRDIFKTILLLCALLCFIFAISSCGEEPRSTHPAQQDIDTLAYSMPQALRVVPGTSWARWNSGDSILLNGFALMSQDAGNSKERIVTDSAVLAWLVAVLPDSFALSGYADTLRLSNDTLYISGQNYVLLSDYLDNTDAQTLSLITNTLAITGGNSVDLSAYLDNDTIYQSLTRSNDTIRLSNSNAIKLDYRIPVTFFGAIGDNTTDNSTAVANALAYSNRISFPPGNYKLKNVSLTSGKDILIEEGAIIKGVTTNDTLFRMSGSVFDITVQGTGSIESCHTGFLHETTSVLSGSIFQQINFSSVKKCFDLYGSVGNQFDKNKFQSGIGYCIYFRNSAASNANKITFNKMLLFDSCGIYFAGGAGTGAGNIIDGNWIEDCTTGGGIEVYNNQTSLRITNNYFEAVGDATTPDVTIIPASSVKGLTFQDNYFATPNAAQTSRVFLDNIIQCRFNGDFVVLNSGDVFADLQVSGSTASGIVFNYVDLNGIGGGTYVSRLFNAVSSTIDVSWKSIPNSGSVTGDNLAYDYYYGDIEIRGAIRMSGTNTGSYLSLARLTTTQRNALTGLQGGEIIYNTTDNVIQGYENGSWVDL